MNISTLIRYILFTGLISAILPSCELINPPEEIPAYLQIDDVSLTVAAGQGSASHKITDVWIDAENTAQGVYEIPTLFPLLNNGPTYLLISAGILDNGISSTRAVYPFYFPDTLTIDLQEKQVYKITPHFTYRTATKFSFIEDFEAGNIFELISGDTGLVRTNEAGNVFEGNFSGDIYLDPNHTVYEGRTTSSYVIEKGSPVYVELNYKCDQQFEVGLYATTNIGHTSMYKWNINAKDTWNKIYLNMGKDVLDLDASSIQVQIRAVFDNLQESSHIYIDNVKLVNY
ncbi:MAG: hypothetical protein IPO83_12975 [Chitinophagaceae bacterium]|nr:hypothetical protein [Chitinophagaceae bacterium]